jgi:hypothetical protein
MQITPAPASEGAMVKLIARILAMIRPRSSWLIEKQPIHERLAWPVLHAATLTR